MLPDEYQWDMMAEGRVDLVTPMEVKKMDEKEISVRAYLLYKLDRTIAVVGIVTLGIVGLITGNKEIAVACAGGLVGYIGGRVGGGKP